MNGTTEAVTSFFSVKTDIFEGPLELLLELIEKRKLLINDISLAAVTDEYMRRVAEMEKSPLRETTQFVHLASTLLLIKSRSLLPVLELTTEEEEGIDDLESRLKRYKIYRDAAILISRAFGTQMLYERQFIPDMEPRFTPDRLTECASLANAIHDVVSELPQKKERPKVQVRKTVSLEDMIRSLQNRIERQLKFSFKDITGATAERGTIIVGFLAILEMVKQGLVLVRQHDRFDDIEVERESTGTPNYR